MYRPSELSDSLFDFGIGGSTIDYQIVVVAFTTSTTGGVNSNYRMTYRVAMNSNAVTNLYVSPLAQNLSNIPVYFDANNATDVTAIRPIASPGKQQDETILYLEETGNIFEPGGQSGSQTNIGGQQEYGYFSYYVFQTCIPVLKRIVGSNTTTLATGSTLTINPNDTIAFDITGSRGCELSKTIVVRKKNNSGSYVVASQGVDYDIVTGSISGTVTDLFNIKFLIDGEFRFDYSGVGYTSDNNPWAAISDSTDPRQKISSNNGAINIFINCGVYTATSNVINVPKIKSTVTAPVTLSSSPFSTYETVEMTITSVPDITTGSWTIIDNDTQVSTDRPMVQQDWIDEINVRCNLVMEVKNDTGQLAIPILTGFGPHKITLPKGEYTFQFKTTKK